MDKLELYNKATEAYYSGEEIIPDYEFDALEEELGLKNKNLGSSHSNVYTITHPYIMGSLSKVQVHDNNFKKYFKEVRKYINKFHNNPEVIITPKYDGCSFEVVYSNYTIVKASTRGDGNMGKDITQLVQHLFTKKGIKWFDHKSYTLRGELLIDKFLFAEKYVDTFKNPRSFVSGLVNADWDESLLDKVYDLSPVIYETCYHHKGEWVEKDWQNFSSVCNYLPKFSKYCKLNTYHDLEEVYRVFLKYRDEECNFPLDGIVIKPSIEYRSKDRKEYPDDCVAIKFKPMLQETTIIGIDWNLGKTGEWIPTIVTEPVIMDGKTISRASASNYGNLIKQGLYIGTKVVLSLAGDIIPYIYKVISINKGGGFGNLPVGVQEGCHLMANLSQEEVTRLKFINSALTLNIPSIGPSVAEQIWDNLKPRHRRCNILTIKPHTIYKALGRGRTAEVARDSYKEVLNRISLSEVIQSCNFTSCGPKVANQIEKQLLGLPYNYSHLPSKAYSWVNDDNSLEKQELQSILSFMNKSINDFEIAQNECGIPVILTGSPKQYRTKKEFLQSHPEYRETSSWSEVKIVFTDSLESTSSKMKKAREKGIDVKLY